jgi:1-acyl-sn-glycerol-3-phosphate acyltransferase
MFKLLFRLGGWKITHFLPKDIKRCVIMAAPHTSNWDFMYGMGAIKIMKLRMRFTIKKEWMKFPLKKLMHNLGALPIDRSQKPDGTKKGTVEAIADLFKTREELLLLITPEGTRSKVEKWRTGFYYVAKEANVPIALGFMDYRTRTCGIDKIIYPTDFNKDMKEIMTFYATKVGKNPENFSVDTSFAV